MRYVPLAELDARAHELPGLVEEAAAEVEAVVAAAPPSPARPSQREADFDLEAYEAVIQDGHRAMVEAAQPVAKRSAASLSGGRLQEAIATAALKVASLAALGGQIELDDLIDMLKSEFKMKRDQIGGIREPTDRFH